jgi:hypothetical protein
LFKGSSRLLACPRLRRRQKPFVSSKKNYVFQRTFGSLNKEVQKASLIKKNYVASSFERDALLIKKTPFFLKDLKELFFERRRKKTFGF